MLLKIMVTGTMVLVEVIFSLLLVFEVKKLLGREKPEEISKKKTP